MRESFYVLLARVRGWFFHRRESADLDQEVETHLALIAEEHERHGASPAEAMRLARLAFGGVAQFKEDQLERRGLPWLGAIAQDVRYAFRLFGREPGFTAGAVLTLAIGIGANTAVFSLLNGYLRPLPVPGASQVVAIGGEIRGDENSLRFGSSYPQLTDLRAHTLPFSDVFAYTPWIGGLKAGDRVTSFLFSAVTDNYFAALGLQPAVGRFFARDEGDHPGTEPHVVLGYSFWQRRLGGDPAVLNTIVRINGHPATVVGVVPKAFLGLYTGTEMDGYITIDTLTKLDAEFRNVYSNRELRRFTVYGRLEPGATLDEAQQAVDVAAREIEREHPDTDLNRGMRVFPERLARPFPQRVLAGVIPAITAFVLALAALVLMLACINVANLLLVRATGRQREMAVRAALGASRGRLVRQSLTESLLLALAGGLAGVLLGLLGKQAFVAGIDVGTDFALVVNFDFDWRVFTYAFIAVVVTGVTVGLWPAIRASRADASAMLHDGGRSHSGGAGRQRVRRLLVVAQVAGSLMLLIVAGLFVRHLGEVQRLDLGFDSEHVLNARLDPRQVGYDATRTATFYRELERRVRAWPEVQAASVAFGVPLGYFNLGDVIFIDGRPVPPGDSPPSVNFNRVDAGYFDTMQIPVLDGRGFRETETGPGAHVAVVNHTMAERFWPGETAIGKHFRVGDAKAPAWEVVGVVRDSKYVLIFEETPPYFYVPIDATTESMGVLQLRATVPPATLAARLEREIRAIDADIPIADLQTMRASLSGAMGFLMYRLGAYQATALGLLGLALAMIGVYSVVSYGASQRTREIGIRVALGAHPRDVVGMILRQGVTLVVAGIVVGVIGAAALMRLMSRFFILHGTSNVSTFAVVTAGLAALALWACYVPARRAMRVDPVVALRHE